MKEIVALVRAVRRRIFANRALERFFRASFVLTCALVGATLAGKLVFLVNASDLFLLAVCGSVLVSVAWSLLAARTRFLAAAVAADERLGLAERISTAVAVMSDASAVSQAVVADAGDKALGIRPEKAFPVTLPGRSWRLAAAVAALAVVLFMPQLDIFGRQAAFKKQQKEQEQVAREVKNFRKEVADLRKALGDKDAKALELIEDVELTLADIEKQGLAGKEALAALSGPLEQLAERMKEIANQMAREALESKGLLPSAELSKALAAASEMARKMKDLLGAGSLSAEEQQQLAKALNELAKQQEALGDAQSKLEDLQEALKQGELTPEQKEQLAKALEELAKKLAESGLGDSELGEQIASLAANVRAGSGQQSVQSLQQAMAGLKKSVSALNSQMGALAKAYMPGMPGQTMFGAMNGMEMGPGGLQDLEDMASALEGMGQFKKSLTGAASLSMENALDRLRLASAMWGSGSGGFGAGMRGAGTGTGGDWPVGADRGTLLEGSSISGHMLPGRMLASFYTDGGDIKNESRVEFQEVILESRQQAKEALTNQKVPRAYERVVKGYFENIASGQQAAELQNPQ